MLKSIVSKVAWVGRTASMVFGLALVLALLFGVATMALGATGGNFILGKANSAGVTSKLTSDVAGPTLNLINNGSAAAATALNLTVPSGKPPMTVNATAGKATNLNADKLDGTDSKAFGTFMATSQSITGECTSAGIWNGCAGYRVTVPAGKVYHVTVWSSVNAEAASTGGLLFYCPAVEGDSIGLSCITPAVSFGRYDTLTLLSGDAVSGASSGEISLSAGHYYISTAIKPSVALSSSTSLNMHTTVMVQDNSVPLPRTE
jgi:hypothetical protein